MRAFFKKRGSLLLFFIFFLFLIFCFLTPMWNVFNLGEGYAFYDAASYNLSASDIEYMRTYGLSGGIVRYYRIGDVTPDGQTLENTRQVLAYIQQGEGMPQQGYHYYTSNLCIQRYFYALAGLLPLSTPALLKLLEVFSAAALAAVLAGLLLWVRQAANTGTAAVLALILGLLSPILANFAKNLYWLPYTWFLPMLGAAFMAGKWQNSLSGGTPSKKWRLLAFIAAFTTCLFKQLHCFEFISCVMVAMMIPYICALMRARPRGSARQWAHTLLAPVSGALCSFAAAVGIKLAVLASSQFVSELQAGTSPWQELTLNILKRTNGQTGEAALAAEGYSTGLLSVINQMLKKSPLVMRGVFNISFYAVIAVLFCITAYVFFLHKKRGQSAAKLNALLTGAWLGLLGPFSWFILARLHVVDHIMIDGAVWYIPFAPLAFAAIIYFISLCLSGFASAKNTDDAPPV